MERPNNNKFGYTYLVNDDSDLIPPQAHLEPMDVYLVAHQIVNLVQSVIESADATFYENNQDTANDYFSGPHYPQSAVDALGYSAEIVGNGGNGAILYASYKMNPPEDDGAAEALVVGADGEFEIISASGWSRRHLM